jgi:hypothetical protein
MVQSGVLKGKRNMIRYRNVLSLLAAALVGATIVGVPTQARAEFALYLQEDGGTIDKVASTLVDFTSLTYSATYHDFTVTILGGSSDNGALLSDVLTSTTSVTNNSGATHNLRLYASQTNFTLPAGTPLLVEASLGGSINTGTLVLSNIFQAFADKNNGLLITSDFTTGPQDATRSGSAYDTGSAFGQFNRTGMFSMSTVASLTISAGGKVNFSAHEEMAPAPAPAGLLLALAGIPAFGVGAWLRRRRSLATA